MTFLEISNRFSSIADGNNLGFGYAPFRHGEEPTVPYIAFSYPERNDFPADNGAYIRISRVRVLLVTRKKDIGLEETVEAAFKQMGISFSKDSDFYQDEDVYISTYETEEIIDAD